MGIHIIFMNVKGKGTYTVEEAMSAVRTELQDPDWRDWETMAFYLVTGEHDLVLIGSAAPDIAVGLAIALTQSGYVTTTVADAYAAEEIAALPSGIRTGLGKHG